MMVIANTAKGEQTMETFEHIIEVIFCLSTVAFIVIGIKEHLDDRRADND